jgi:uncharacterized membrane protein
MSGNEAVRGGGGEGLAFFVLEAVRVAGAATGRRGKERMAV